MSFDATKGHSFEQQIASFLGQHGYTVTTNAHMAGRSGAVHELDVVGDKSDGLTSSRIIVECKGMAHGRRSRGTN
jgi:Holliday junction resolvase